MLHETVWDYYNKHGREMPWRQSAADGSFDPYRIMLSEIMLQQTQVSRVIPKYEAFLAEFPSIEVLAAAPLSRVLAAWSGLGYNRRAKFLHQAAQAVAGKPFPQTLDALVALPGIGHNTAAAILVYAFNQPVAFLETNIRTVYIHHYFADNLEQVSDKELLPLVEQTIDREHPREWFWALMDYGAHLKATVGNLSRHSKHYAKQSKFEGSLRQIRGQIIKALIDEPQSRSALKKIIKDERLDEVLLALESENLISKSSKYALVE